MAMCAVEFQDERSQILFVLSYMKGGTAGLWATQRINTVLYDNDSTPQTFDEFTAELDSMFTDPNQQVTAYCRWDICVIPSPPLRAGFGSQNSIIQLSFF